MVQPMQLKFCETIYFNLATLKVLTELFLFSVVTNFIKSKWLYLNKTKYENRNFN